MKRKQACESHISISQRSTVHGLRNLLYSQLQFHCQKKLAKGYVISWSNLLLIHGL